MTRLTAQFLGLLSLAMIAAISSANDTSIGKEVATTETAVADSAIPTTLILDSLTGSIELINGAKPKTDIRLTLTNTGETDFNGSFGFHGSETSEVSVLAGESASVNLIPLSRHAGKIDKLQKTEIDLELELNGVEAPSIADIDINVFIPESAYPVVRSEPPIMDNGLTEDAPYEYYSKAQQPQTLKITYNPGPINLQIRKTIYPTPIVAGPVEITIEVTNKGSQAAHNIILRDTLDNTDFSAKGAAFSRFESDTGTELVWETTIDSLEPGASQQRTYVVNATGDIADKQLPATTAIIDDELSGLSNKVWLPKWH